MAIARLCVKVGKVGKATPHAEYIARQGQYARARDVEKTEATGHGNMPAWAQNDSSRFWQAADAYERKNGTAYREFEIALPRELTPDQRLSLLKEFIKNELGEKHAYQFAIHTPKGADGQEQPHAHLMFSERQNDGIERDPEQYFKRYNAKNPEKGGAKKGFGPRAGQTLTREERAIELKELRARWETLCNDHLARARVDQRIDMRSHKELGTGLEPERKLLPSEWRREGKGKILEFRLARRELLEARAEVKSSIPSVQAEILSLEQARAKLQAQAKLQGQAKPDPLAPYKRRPAEEYQAKDEAFGRKAMKEMEQMLEAWAGAREEAVKPPREGYLTVAPELEEAVAKGIEGAYREGPGGRVVIPFKALGIPKEKLDQAGITKELTPEGLNKLWTAVLREQAEKRSAEMERQVAVADRREEEAQKELKTMEKTKPKEPPWYVPWKKAEYEKALEAWEARYGELKKLIGLGRQVRRAQEDQKMELFLHPRLKDEEAARQYPTLGKLMPEVKALEKRREEEAKAREAQRLKERQNQAQKTPKRGRSRGGGIEL